MAMASSMVRTTFGGGCWAARTAGSEAAIIRPASAAAVLLMSDLLPGRFGIPDAFEDEAGQVLGGERRQRRLAFPEAQMGVALEHGLDEGRGLSGIHAPEFPGGHALVEDPGAQVDELLALV